MSDDYLCPNGHRVDRVRAITCRHIGCQASVIYEPVAHGLALRAALVRAHAALDAEHGHTTRTWADRERWSTGSGA